MLEQSRWHDFSVGNLSVYRLKLYYIKRVPWLKWEGKKKQCIFSWTEVLFFSPERSVCFLSRPCSDNYFIDRNDFIVERVVSKRRLAASKWQLKAFPCKTSFLPLFLIKKSRVQYLLGHSNWTCKTSAMLICEIRPLKYWQWEQAQIC